MDVSYEQELYDLALEQWIADRFRKEAEHERYVSGWVEQPE